MESCVFKKLYLSLFNSVTDALRLIERGKTQAAADVLRKAQADCEKRYMDEGDDGCPCQADVGFAHKDVT